jgi:hypothetical protein
VGAADGIAAHVLDKLDFLKIPRGGKGVADPREFLVHAHAPKKIAAAVERKPVIDRPVKFTEPETFHVIINVNAPR